MAQWDAPPSTLFPLILRRSLAFLSGRNLARPNPFSSTKFER